MMRHKMMDVPGQMMMSETADVPDVRGKQNENRGWN